MVGWGPESGRFTGDPYIPATASAASTASTAPVQPYIAVQTVSSGLVAQFGPAPAVGWSIRRITITADNWAYCDVFVTPLPARGVRPADEYRVTGTPSGDNDEYDANTPVYVPEGQYVVICWQSGPTLMRARLEYIEGAA